MQCLPQGTRCTVYLNASPLCHRHPARVARPSLPRAGDAIHPVLGKGVAWFTRLLKDMASYSEVSPYRLL